MYDYLSVKMINGKDTIYAELNYDLSFNWMFLLGKCITYASMFKSPYFSFVVQYKLIFDIYLFSSRMLNM